MNYLLLGVLFVALDLAQSAEPLYLDGKLAEAKTLPLQVDCPTPYTYIYIGGVTFNGTAIKDSLQVKARKECEKQLKEQEGKGGAVISCYLTFGKTFDTQDTGTVRAVYKCLISKPDKAPGGKEWEKNNKRTLLSAKPNGKNEVTFKCPGLYEMVELENIFQEGEEVTAGLQKKKDYIRSECYKQTVNKLVKGEKSAMRCTIELSAEEADSAELFYRCSEPSTNSSESVTTK